MNGAPNNESLMSDPHQTFLMVYEVLFRKIQ